MSCIERCPHFRGKFLSKKEHLGHSKVSLIQRSRDFRVSFKRGSTVYQGTQLPAGGFKQLLVLCMLWVAEPGNEAMQLHNHNRGSSSRHPPPPQIRNDLLYHRHQCQPRGPSAERRWRQCRSPGDRGRWPGSPELRPEVRNTEHIAMNKNGSRIFF